MGNKFSVNINSEQNCYGCSACFSICPQGAIKMKEDSEGFLYPHLVKNRCVNCGLCNNICPDNVGSGCVSKYYAVQNNCSVRMSSSSGGVFSALAEYVINRNGVVYGAGFDGEFNVCHQRADDDAWIKFRGSKYVQSDMKDNFGRIKTDLIDGKYVLFVGTPCQVSGLKNFLSRQKISTDNLIAVDVICHGVPSPKVWRDYLKFVTKNNVSSVNSVCFRNKGNHGWHGSTLKITDVNDNDLIDISQGTGAFWGGFCNNLTLRPSCYTCSFPSYNRVGDFTLGDYWGVENSHPDIDDNLGTSLVFVNTTKANNVWNDIKNNLYHCEIKKHECEQPSLITPSQAYGDRSFYWMAYKLFGLKAASKICGIEPILKQEKYYYKCIVILLKILRKINRLIKKYVS